MAEILKCGRPECDVAKNGLCGEGHTPRESCPSFGHVVNVLVEEYNGSDSDDATIDDQRVEDTRISLPSGEPLSAEQVDEFLRWKPITFVSIVGEFDSGKTTLICALYDQFLRGKFAQRLFAGSRTLVGFEKRAHHSRIDSGRAAPDTLRTSLFDGLRYFHLSLVSEATPRTRVELMLSDRAGETYQKARGNSALVDELIEVKKAKHVVFLLDGGRLSDPVQRSGAMQAVRQSIRAFLDGGALNTNSRVQVVTTKIDLLKDALNLESLEDQLTKFLNSLVADFGQRLNDLSFWSIAARDPTGEHLPAHGIEELLVSWCSDLPISITREPIQVQLKSEFDKLLLRTPIRDLQ